MNLSPTHGESNRLCPKHRALRAVQRQPVPLTDLALPAGILADSRTMGPMFQVTSLLALCLPGCSLMSGYSAVFIPGMAKHDAGSQESQTLQED